MCSRFSASYVSKPPLPKKPLKVNTSNAACLITQQDYLWNSKPPPMPQKHNQKVQISDSRKLCLETTKMS
jgi:hypothetical protein